MQVAFRPDTPCRPRRPFIRGVRVISGKQADHRVLHAALRQPLSWVPQARLRVGHEREVSGRGVRHQAPTLTHPYAAQQRIAMKANSPSPSRRPPRATPPPQVSPKGSGRSLANRWLVCAFNGFDADQFERLIAVLIERACASPAQMAIEPMRTDRGIRGTTKK